MKLFAASLFTAAVLSVSAFAQDVPLDCKDAATPKAGENVTCFQRAKLEALEAKIQDIQTQANTVLSPFVQQRAQLIQQISAANPGYTWTGNSLQPTPKAPATPAITPAHAQEPAKK